MSFILLGILNSQASAAGANYWLHYAFDPNSVDNLFYRGVTSDLVVIGQTVISTNQAGIITKLDSASGTPVYQKSIANTTGDLRVFHTRGAVSDGTNQYLMFQDEQSGNSDLILVKIDSTPSIVAQRRYGGANNLKTTNSDIGIDSSNNIVGGGYYETANNEINFGLWNSSLTLQWQRRIDPNSGAFYDPRFTFDSSGNVIVAAQWNNSPTQLGILKYNSSGTLQWQRTLTASSDLPQVAVTTDASDNVYVSYRDQNTSGWGAGLVKYNSSGTIQFQKTLSRASWNYNGNGQIIYGSDGNIYAYHTLNDGGSGRLLLVSYDTSGNVNWQRYIDTSINGVNDVSAGYLAMNDNGDLVLTANTYDIVSGLKRWAITMVLPANGDFIGTYTDGTFSFIGEASSHSLSTTTYTSATSSFTVGTVSRTETSSSLSLGNRTLTTATFTIG